MTILPKNLKPSVAGGVLTLAERLIQNRYHWLARPTDTMVVDHVDLIAKRVYLRRTDDQAAHNEYPYPYDTSLSFAPGDVVTVQWTSTGPHVVGGGVPASPPVTGGGTTVTEPNLAVLDTNSVDLSVADDPVTHTTQIAADVRLDPTGALQTTAAGVGNKVDGTTVQIVGDMLTAPGGGSSGIEVTDGTTDLTGVDKITFTGATVGGASPNATVTVTGGGGGGGGGSTGPGAATYGISVELDGPTNDPVAWDHIIEGDDVYLDVGHTDGLTIPAGGDGDYLINAHLWIGTDLASNVDSSDWSVETIMNIEHWRSGSLLKSYTDQDWFGMSAADFANIGFINDIPIQANTSVPACLAGDVIKVSVSAIGSGAAHLGTYVDPNSELTWVSIARTGKVSSSGTAAIYEMSNNVNTTSNTQAYAAWDTLKTGHDMYLDVSHTDGLTIPTNGDGDYHIDTELLFKDGTSGLTGTNWSIQYTFSIEVWRAGSQVLYLTDHDMYGESSSFTNDEREFRLSATLPSLAAGDVIKVGWFYLNGPGPTFGFQRIDNTSGEHWVSIAKIG